MTAIAKSLAPIDTTLYQQENLKNISAEVRFSLDPIPVSQFIDLRKEAGFYLYSEKDLNEALCGSTIQASLWKRNADNTETMISCARVISDGRVSFFIKDFIVAKQWRNQGYGSIMLDEILHEIKRIGCPHTYVGLMSTPGKESFYISHGFVERPNSELGAGMLIYL